MRSLGELTALLASSTRDESQYRRACVDLSRDLAEELRGLVGLPHSQFQVSDALEERLYRTLAAAPGGGFQRDGAYLFCIRVTVDDGDTPVWHDVALRLWRDPEGWQVSLAEGPPVPLSSGRAGHESLAQELLSQCLGVPGPRRPGSPLR